MEKIIERANKEGYKTMPIGNNPRVLIVGIPDNPKAEQKSYQCFLAEELSPHFVFHQDVDSIMNLSPKLLSKVSGLDGFVLSCDLADEDIRKHSGITLDGKTLKVKDNYREQVIANRIIEATRKTEKNIIAFIKPKHLGINSMLHPYLTDPTLKISYLCIDQTGKHL